MFAASAPQRANDHSVVTERAVQVAAELSKIDAPQIVDRRVTVRSSRAWEQCQNLDGALEFRDEQIPMVAVLKPPFRSRSMWLMAVLVN